MKPPLWRILAVMAVDILLIVAVAYSLSDAMGNPLIVVMSAICFIGWNYQRGFKAWRLFAEYWRNRKPLN